MFSSSLVSRFGFIAGVTLAGLTMTSLAAPADARNRNQPSEISDDDQARVPDPALASSPSVAVVSIKDQRIAVYDGSGRALRARISSGAGGYETPVGVFSILQKQEEHYSNIYDDASMPFMQRITWSGIALHAGVLPGYPASHGCVRMPESFAQQIFPLTKLGMRVVVSKYDIAPSPISHALLLKPAPVVVTALAVPAVYENDGSAASSGDAATDRFLPDVSRWPARAAQLEALKSIAAEKKLEADSVSPLADELKAVVKTKETAKARVVKRLSRAESAKKSADKKVEQAAKTLASAKKEKAVKRAEAAKAKADAAAKVADDRLIALKAEIQGLETELASATDEWTKADAIKTKAVAAKQAAQWKTFPVSVFISRKTQRLYVRQGNEPVFDAPITISEPETPIGTHVFTALDYKDQGKDLRWNVVSIALTDKGSKLPSGKDRRRSEANYAPPMTDVAVASAALDRITIPPDVEERISDYVWPGSSMIVSDEELSKETGTATEFVVVMSGEPQGGLKKRPRKPAPSSYNYDDPYDPYARYDRYDRYDRYNRYDRRGGGYRNPSLFNWW